MFRAAEAPLRGALSAAPDPSPCVLALNFVAPRSLKFNVDALKCLNVSKSCSSIRVDVTCNQLNVKRHILSKADHSTHVVVEVLL